MLGFYDISNRCVLGANSSFFSESSFLVINSWFLKFFIFILKEILRKTRRSTRATKENRWNSTLLTVLSSRMKWNFWLYSSWETPTGHCTFSDHPKYVDCTQYFRRWRFFTCTRWSALLVAKKINRCFCYFGIIVLIVTCWYVFYFPFDFISVRRWDEIVGTCVIFLVKF